MSDRPNLLVLMTDQMQAAVLDGNHPCQTPHLDRLMRRGLRFTRAYTTNAICSPARAGLMTGLLPHNHGVLTVTHTTDEDQCRLRTDKPHWAQRLRAAGYRTGYFGKWHVDRHDALQRFGWDVAAETSHGDFISPRYEAKQRALCGDAPPPPEYTQRRDYHTPGFRENVFYGVTTTPPEKRPMGIATACALDFLDEALAGSEPFCCMLSVPEPHDPFVAGVEAFSRYDVDDIALPASAGDDLADRPGAYRKLARVWAEFSDGDKRHAAACYYANITEIDAQFGRVLEQLERAGKLDNTLVVVTTDHGELLGAHGLYCKNFGAFEEVYNIPLVAAGPGIAAGQTTSARVGSHELCPTILEWCGCAPIENLDGRSFAAVCRNPAAAEDDFTSGYAEYHGGRFLLTQRIVWEGPWKLVFNGFDFDELYNLDEDPHEMHNRAEDPACRAVLARLYEQMWRVVRQSGDHSLLNCGYAAMRMATLGPGA